MSNVSSPKVLTEEDKAQLELQNSRLVPEFTSSQLEKNAKKHWDLFYKRNETRFFKDRHWTTREFEELAGCDDASRVLLEIGCGAGNFVFPLLEANSNLIVYACDLSSKAVELVESRCEDYGGRLTAFQADITTEGSLGSVPPADLVSLVFVLSAVHPDKFRQVVLNVFNAVKPGGVVLFRDYGLYDMAQIRFKPGHKISENFYARQDGTRSYFFSTEQIGSLFSDEGFIVLHNSYVHRRTVNAKEDVDVPRIFVQGKFQKPL